MRLPEKLKGVEEVKILRNLRKAVHYMYEVEVDCAEGTEGPVSCCRYARGITTTRKSWVTATPDISAVNCEFCKKSWIYIEDTIERDNSD